MASAEADAELFTPQCFSLIIRPRNALVVCMAGPPTARAAAGEDHHRPHHKAEAGGADAKLLQSVIS